MSEETKKENAVVEEQKVETSVNEESKVETSVNNTPKTKEEEKKTEMTETSKETKKVVKPKLFYKADERVLIAVNGYHNKETGELALVLPVDNEEKNETFDDLFIKVEYKFWFSRVPYDKLNRYRSRSMIYNTEDQNNTINEIRLREFFLVFHLLDWNLTDDDGKKIELKFDTNKALSDESLSLIYTLPHNLIDVVLTTFERKIA